MELPEIDVESGMGDHKLCLGGLFFLRLQAYVKVIRDT